MYRNLLFILITIFLTACANKNQVVFKDYEEQKSNKLDMQILSALNYEYFNDYKKSRDIFLDLFKEYKDVVFLQNAYFLTLANNLNDIKEIDNIARVYVDENDNLKRLSAFYALKSLELNRAQKLINELLAKNSNDLRNLELYGDLFVQKKDFINALKYYKLAYEQNPTEDFLFKIISTYAILDDTKSIKKFLEQWRQKNGCTLKTCSVLAKIYNDEKKFDLLENIYIDLYKISNNKSFIYSLLDILNKEQKKQEALDLALEYDLDNDIKIFLYQDLKKFNEAKNLSLKMYEQSGNKEYLMRAAVFEFEQASLDKKITPSLVLSVAKKFEQGIDYNSNALYLNYYGYLLIDNDIDIEKGIYLVKLALEKEPNNLYYIDSLAWGYYKLKDCKKAWEFLEKTFVDKEFSNSKESKDHIKAIKECLK
ncbi:ATP-dependent nuclease subunit B [Campylobacter sp. 2018MI35]|uniref:tetratricopeptide repeat protein n=1 Tax=Campylobacter sp. 2018MI34 TaxID=2800582 RepID=UPI001902ED27|nr:ATP-dependent nuclease subunit B [Campylobacter sp. 2018MI34]MBK1991648.1 ATP-dependent nuclease subunit B [Campylobacter sp. 2018MI34]